MEADMVAEGFCLSEEMHGVKYLKFIADGDSSTFAKIKEKVPYGSSVRKVECTNHALKNYGKHLYKLKKDTNLSLAGRKLLTQNAIECLQKNAKRAIQYHSEHQQNVLLLKEDLNNGLLHVFGDHTLCREEICESAGDKSNSKVDLLKATTMFYHINGKFALA